MSPRTHLELWRRDGYVVTRLRGGQLTPRRLPDVAGRVRVALVATEALLLAGDDVSIDVTVSDGLSLEIVETAGTVAYDMRGRTASWKVDVSLDDHATLAWAGLPFVVSDGADVLRSTRLHLGHGSAVALRETVVLGRTGEEGGRLDTSLRADREGRPLLVESLVVDPGARRDPAVLGGHRCVDAVTTLGARLDDPAALQLEREGTVCRWLGQDAHESPLARKFEMATALISGRNIPSLPLSLASRP